MKVKAKDETIARVIRHPNGARFGADGTAYWPDDQFTKRRIRDGDVTAVETKSKEVAPAPKRAAAAPASRSE
jgi:hypothetical protein